MAKKKRNGSLVLNIAIVLLIAFVIGVGYVVAEQMKDADLLTMRPQAAEEAVLPQNANVFYPTKDAFVHSTRPEKNFGDETELRFTKNPSRMEQYEYRSYIGFDIDKLEPDAVITSAVLRVYLTKGAAHGGYLYQTETDWYEPGITWERKPALIGTIIFEHVGPAIKDTWLEYDVSDTVQGNGEYSFALISKEGGELSGASSEAVEHRPELVVQTTKLK